MADNIKCTDPSFKFSENLLKAFNECYKFYRDELQELSQKANEVSGKDSVYTECDGTDVINSPSQQFRVNLWRHEMNYSEYLQMAQDCILDSIVSADGDLPDYQLAILRGVWETLEMIAH